MRRWLVERFFAWIQWQRRILVRWEYHARNFLGFVQFASSLSSSGDFEIVLVTSRQHHPRWYQLQTLLGRRATSSPVGLAPVNVLHVREGNVGILFTRILKVEGVAYQKDQITVEILGYR
jgi:hypothetical protein